MKQNPLERQAIEKENLLKGMRQKYGDLFDDGKEEIKSIIEKFILQMDVYEREGVVFNKTETVNGLRESLEIQNKEDFIAHMLKILEPIVAAKFTQPQNYEKAERNALEDTPDYKRLSEVLSVEFSKDDEGTVRIHLASAKELIKGEGIGYFKKEVEIGLRKLASEVVLPNKKIKKVLAQSWIVAKNPSLVERLGFTYDGIVPEGEDDDGGHFDELGNRRPVAKAFITREDLLAKYGSKN